MRPSWAFLGDLCGTSSALRPKWAAVRGCAGLGDPSAGIVAGSGRPQGLGWVSEGRTHGEKGGGLASRGNPHEYPKKTKSPLKDRRHVTCKIKKAVTMRPGKNKINYRKPIDMENDIEYNDGEFTGNAPLRAESDMEHRVLERRQRRVKLLRR